MVTFMKITNKPEGEVRYRKTSNKSYYILPKTAKS